MHSGAGKDTLNGESGSDQFYGSAGKDILNDDQGAGNDSLAGGSGRDFLNGGSGLDKMAGGSSNDTFIVETSSNLVQERAGGSDADMVRSNALDYTLNSGSNELRGRGDVLNDAEGRDLVVGGMCDDTFVVDYQNHMVRDDSSQGGDLVGAEIDFTLPDGSAFTFIEHLRLQGGFGNIDGTGNSLDNSGHNALRGLGGDDSLSGRDGGDPLFGGGSSSDTLYLTTGDLVFGGSGVDWFRFNGDLIAMDERPEIGDFDGASLNASDASDRFVFAAGLEVGSFTYVEDAAFSGSGDSKARIASTGVVKVDYDSDGSADISVEVAGLSSAGALTGSDFLWL